MLRPRFSTGAARPPYGELIFTSSSAIIPSVSLREKLRRLETPARAAQADPAPASSVARELARLRVAADARRAAEEAGLAGDPEATLPEGETLATPYGAVWRLRRRFPEHHRHGDLPLGAAEASSGKAAGLAARDAGLDGFDPREAVYLDTETTGLAGGTGTIPFLVGIGRFLEGEFVLDQYFLRDLDEERAMLVRIAEETAGAGRALVSFNGKSFDRPLMVTRYRLYRLADPWPGAPHWDLLHASRRLWRARLADARLATIERELLGLRRVGDVSGAEIPFIYRAYLRLGRAPGLRRVIEHNALDVLSMVTLAGKIGRMLADPEEAGGLEAGECLALGELHRRRGEPGAEAWYARARDRAESPEAWWEASRRLAEALRKLDREAEAAAIWAEMRAAPRPLDAGPWEEEAKREEHRLRRLDRALALVEEATARGVPGAERLAGRAARLRRRLERPPVAGIRESAED